MIERSQEKTEGGTADMLDLISVIVPVYNSEEYLEECVESVLKQTYTCWELILIDDGSEDCSLEICKSLCDRDKRIRLLRQEHKGVSAARNAGMKAAEGKYLFFLDSDDVVHPQLLETLYLLLEEGNTTIATERRYYAKDGAFRRPETWRRESVGSQKSSYLNDERAIDYRFFGSKDTTLYVIGGKMIRREVLENISFHEKITHGEDTLFLYQLIAGGADVSVLKKDWYYYRVHTDRSRYLFSVDTCRCKYAVNRYIRNRELQNGRRLNALRWENTILCAIMNWYLAGRKNRDARLTAYAESLAKTEMKSKIYSGLDIRKKLSFFLILYCYPLYRVIAACYPLKTRRSKAEVGIITFHCSDNYGAILQAYGLRKYLRHKGVEADIVRYEPPFMTGRHWWIPYISIGGIVGCLGLGWKGWLRNLHMGRDFFTRRSNMRSFRKNYLVKRGQKPLFWTGQMRTLPYHYYIVGSDQIWNPDITLGLRGVYFGAFNNENKRKVTAYAASLGGESLLPEYEEEFAVLLQNVDEVSVREEEAVSYVEKFTRRAVRVLPDPVFLLKKEEWQKIEKTPVKAGYILVYMTEKNDRMTNYVKRLSQEKSLSVVELRCGAGESGAGIMTDYTAGPAEFLGYIHKADYVVTNSFHGIALSIIYQKLFCVFMNSNSGARISNILQRYGLNSRLYREGEVFEIDDLIDWDFAERQRKKDVRSAETFLMGAWN